MIDELTELRIAARVAALGTLAARTAIEFHRQAGDVAMEIIDNAIVRSGRGDVRDAKREGDRGT
jgi:hypothetical protein